MVKIYKYVKIDIDTGETIEEDSYEYEGEIAQCFGGGTSGAFTFPGDKAASAYNNLSQSIADMYKYYLPAEIVWAGGVGSDNPSPYSGETTPNPDTYLGSASAGMTQHRMNLNTAIVDTLDEDADFSTYFESVRGEADEADSFPDVSMASYMSTVHSAEKTSVETAVLQGMTERTAIQTAIDNALTAAAAVVAGTPIAARVTAYEARIRKQYLRAMSRVSAGFADINAVNSSAFVLGLAFIERQYLDDVDHYDAELDLTAYKEGFKEYMDTFKRSMSEYMQSYREAVAIHMSSQASATLGRKRSRDAAIMEGVRTVSQMLGMKLGANSNAAQMQSDINRIRHAYKIEEHNTQLEIDYADTAFPLTIASNLGNVLASAGGAAVVPNKMSKGQSIVSGMASGAAIGLEAGKGNPWIAGAGAVLGGIGGAIQ